MTKAGQLNSAGSLGCSDTKERKKNLRWYIFFAKLRKVSFSLPRGLSGDLCLRDEHEFCNIILCLNC